MEPEVAKPKKFLVPAIIFISLLLIIVVFLASRYDIPVISNLFNSSTPKPEAAIVLPDGVSPGEHCADIEIDGETTNVCSICGDKKCEQYEVCQNLVTGRGYTTEDCGPLFCPEDCKGLVPGS